MCRVVNKNRETFDVYIGRGSMWGNPYHIDLNKGHDRKYVIARYASWLSNQLAVGNITVNDLVELNGKRLGCYCKPKACHGDVIVEAVNWASND